ncbi:hypothetical protein [Pantoea sp. 1.19]|uniref:hypothetical protein n=1 Tax=Pantoea sp. 1.19 TaxID=1925589 RepID=UPI00094912D5|nr:hypothetical protein [Pantoea sp. 1.19]
MRNIATLFMVIGLAGLLVAGGLNLYAACFAANRDAAPLFSTLWWTRWFPLYLSGLSLLGIGLVWRVSGRRLRES